MFNLFVLRVCSSKYCAHYVPLFLTFFKMSKHDARNSQRWTPTHTHTAQGRYSTCGYEYDTASTRDLPAGPLVTDGLIMWKFSRLTRIDGFPRGPCMGPGSANVKYRMKLSDVTFFFPIRPRDGPRRNAGMRPWYFDVEFAPQFLLISLHGKTQRAA